MLIDVKVPSVGESITEGFLAEWVHQDGDVVKTDDPLFVLETDKVTMTVNSEHAGQLKIIAAAGSPVKIGEPIATIDTDVKPAQAQAPAIQAGPVPVAPPPLVSVPQTSGPALNPIAGMPAAKAKLAAMLEGDLFSPAVRRMLEEYRLDPAAIPSSGRDGRLTKEDVVRFLERSSATGPAPEAGVRSAPPALSAVPSHQADGAPGTLSAVRRAGELRERQTRIPMTPLRARIAERMIVSQQSSATLTTFNEADLGSLVDLRRRYREAFKARHGVDLTYLPFFVKAVSEALDAVPELASWIEGGDIVRNNYRDVGIAVAAEQGLTVPVLRDVERKGIPQLQGEIDGLARKVREKRVTLEDLKGAVFSITNAGSYGALMGTPILNPPQSGILGMYAIQERPVARDSQVVIRPMMVLALSYDHRVVDGKAAGTFLKLVAETVANPGRMLLEI